MYTVEVTMTPDHAKDLLTRNKANRKVRKHLVTTLARVIERGEWHLTHQGIAVDVQGNLIDGQHRLMAIVRANKAVPMLLSTGLDSDAYTYLDQGMVRTANDHFKDRFIASSVAFLGRVIAGRRLTLAQFDALHRCLSPFISAMGELSHNSRSKIAKGTIGAGFIVMAVRDKSKALLYGQIYNALITMDTLSTALTPKAHALLRQMTTIRFLPYQEFAKTIRALENDDNFSDSLVVKDPVGMVADARRDLHNLIIASGYQRELLINAEGD